jgi:hypothetical protein
MRVIPVGLRGTYAMTVKPEHLASQFKDAILPPVLATPIMGHFELNAPTIDFDDLGFGHDPVSNRRGGEMLDLGGGAELRVRTRGHPSRVAILPPEIVAPDIARRNQRWAPRV